MLLKGEEGKEPHKSPFAEGRKEEPAKGEQGKGGEDHKAAIAKMHPEHVHKLVKAAHEGKFGHEAQGMAQQAMQAPAQGGEQQQQQSAPSSPFADGGQQEPEEGSAPTSMWD